MALEHMTKRFSFIIAMGLAATLISVPALAGFEWVPVEQNETPVVQQPAPTEPAAAPVFPVEAIESSEDTMMMPLPTIGQQDMQPPAQTAPVTAPAPQPIELQQQAAPTTPPPEPMIKTMDMSAPAKPETPAPESVSQELVASQPSTSEPTTPGPAAMDNVPVVKTKIIMPSNAPQSAMDKTPGSERLDINPFPQTQPTTPPLAIAEPARTPEATVPQTAAAAPDTVPDTNVQQEFIGFGNDMPLAIALRQVAPASYAFSFGTDVNPGAKVSWSGGSSWEMVVTDMISPLGLVAVIRNNTIHVKHAHAEMGAATQTEILEPTEEIETSAETLLSEAPTAAENTAIVIEAALPETETAPIIVADQSEGSSMGNTVKSITINSTDKTAEDMNQEALKMAKAKEDSNLSSQLPEPIETKNQAPLEAKIITSDVAPPPPPMTDKIEITEKNTSQSTSPLPAENLADAVTPSAGKDVAVLQKAALGDAPISASRIRFWEAKQGSSLKETLAEWSSKAHTTLVWNASQDYLIKSNLLVNDTFQNAVKMMFTKVLEDPTGPTLELISEAGTDEPSKLVINDRS